MLPLFHVQFYMLPAFLFAPLASQALQAPHSFYAETATPSLQDQKQRSAFAPVMRPMDGAGQGGSCSPLGMLGATSPPGMAALGTGALHAGWTHPIQGGVGSGGGVSIALAQWKRIWDRNFIA